MNDDDARRRLQGFPLDEHKQATKPEPAINWEALIVLALTVAIAYFVVFPVLNWLIRLL